MLADALNQNELLAIDFNYDKEVGLEILNRCDSLGRWDAEAADDDLILVALEAYLEEDNYFSYKTFGGSVQAIGHRIAESIAAVA